MEKNILTQTMYNNHATAGNNNIYTDWNTLKETETLGGELLGCLKGTVVWGIAGGTPLSACWRIKEAQEENDDHASKY